MFVLKMNTFELLVTSSLDESQCSVKDPKMNRFAYIPITCSLI
jgi:hypothetical protein